MSEELKLFIWTGFYPNYAGGLAFAIAETEEEAKAMIVKKVGIEEEVSPEWKECEFPEMKWGTLEVRPLTEKIAYGIVGGE